MKKTKIVCTIGPASEKKTTLKKMMKSGMNVARLNFSHGTYANHKLLIKNIRAAAADVKQPVAIMQDLQGPRIRLGVIQDKGIALKKGELVVLAYEQVTAAADSEYKKRTVVPLGYNGLHQFLNPGNHVLINDGLIDIEVQKVEGSYILGKVKKPGMLFSHKGINLPGANIDTPVITKKDKEDLKFGLSQGVNYIALSFVKDANDIKALRKLIGKHDAQIIAKIERQEALDNFDEILEAVDGIMIARGDLGIEVQPAKVPLAQKEIIRKCMLVGKPAIVATQMLESMITNPRPTRAEVSDVANAVIDHADAVMLSGESAFGKYPVEAVQIMADIAETTEHSKYDNLPRHTLDIDEVSVEDEISYVVRDLSDHDHVRAIVVNSTSGRSARMIARHRPETTIIMLTHDKRTISRAALTWGVYPLFVPKCKSVDQLIQKSIEALRPIKLVRKGDNIVLATAHPVAVARGVNLVKLHTL